MTAFNVTVYSYDGLISARRTFPHRGGLNLSLLKACADLKWATARPDAN